MPEPIVPEETVVLPEGYIPSPTTVEITVLCPICDADVTINAYSSTTIVGKQETDLVIAGSLHGTARHSCAQVG